MTTTAFDDQFVSATETILARNVRDEHQQVHDLQVRLAAAIQRATDAEAELARLREQKPVAWMLECQQWTGDTAWQLSWSQSGAGQCNRLEGDSHQRPLYAAPVPTPAVPTNTIPEGDDFNGTTPHMIRCIESLVSMNDRGVLAPHGLCGHSRTLLLASANRLRQQQAHVVPAVPGEWRETLSKLVGIVESSAKFHGCNGVTKQARALLQSAEVRHD